MMNESFVAKSNKSFKDEEDKSNTTSKKTINNLFPDNRSGTVNESAWGRSEGQGGGRGDHSIIQSDDVKAMGYEIK